MPLINPSSGGFVNPMTSVGDLIIGGSSGAATRLAKGSAGQVLTVSSGGTLDYETPTSGGALIAALVRSQTLQTLPSSATTSVTWPTKVFDTGGLFSSGSPTVFTIPAGYNYARAAAYIAIDIATLGIANFWILHYYNGGASSVKRAASSPTTQNSARYVNLASPWFPVTASDTIALRCGTFGTAININNSDDGSSFGIEVRA